MEELQRELNYLSSTQAKDAEYELSPAAAAGAAALEAAAAKERSAMEVQMRSMADDFRRQVPTGGGVGKGKGGRGAEGSLAAVACVWVGVGVGSWVGGCAWLCIWD